MRCEQRAHVVRCSLRVTWCAAGGHPLLGANSVLAAADTALATAQARRDEIPAPFLSALQEINAASEALKVGWQAPIRGVPAA